MDFTEEISVTLKRRVVTRPPIDLGLGDRIRDALKPVFKLPHVIDPRLSGVFGRRLVERGPRLSSPIDTGTAKTLSARIDADRLVVTDETKGTSSTIKAPKLSADERAALDGLILRFDARGALLDWLGGSRVEWHDTALRIIQNGDLTKALLLPTGSGALPNGQWRLEFDLVRRWFDTTDPVGPTNAYIADAEIAFLIA